MATLDVLTLEEARIALDVTQVDIHDDEIPQYITAVSEKLDQFIGPIVQRTITGEKLDGGRERENKKYVFLRFYPVVSISSVTEDGVALVLDEDYYVDEYSENRDLLGNCLERWNATTNKPDCWAEGRRNIVVSYVAGRAANTASVPELYKTAARLTLANFWRSQQDSTGGLGEFQVPQSYFPRWAIPQAARQLLESELQQPRLFL